MKAQASSEFLIIFGVMLVVATMVFSVGVMWPSFTQSIKKAETDRYWASAQPFSIRQNSIYMDNMVLEIVNTEPVSLTIKSIVVNGKEIPFSSHAAPFTWDNLSSCCAVSGDCACLVPPGKRAVFSTDNLSLLVESPCRSGGNFQAGKTYDVEFAIRYYGTNSTNVKTQGGNVRLLGTCQACENGTCAIVPPSLPCTHLGEACGSGTPPACCKNESLTCAGTCCRNNGGECGAGTDCCSGYCDGAACSDKPVCNRNGEPCKGAGQSTCCEELVCYPPNSEKSVCTPCLAEGYSGCDEYTQCCAELTCDTRDRLCEKCVGVDKDCKANPCCEGFTCDKEKLICRPSCGGENENCESGACCEGLTCDTRDYLCEKCVGVDKDCKANPCCEGFTCDEKEFTCKK